MLLKCERGCVHEYQDKKYGQGIRVHTLPSKAKQEKGEKPRCTVCGVTFNLPWNARFTGWKASIVAKVQTVIREVEKYPALFKRP